MNDKGFLDTNIVVYAYSQDKPDKRLVARELFKKSCPVVSTQVLGEFSNVLRKKFCCEYMEIARAVNQIANICRIVVVTSDYIIRALALADKYGYHFFMIA